MGSPICGKPSFTLIRCQEFDRIKADLRRSQREHYDQNACNLEVHDGMRVYVHRPPPSAQPQCLSPRFTHYHSQYKSLSTDAWTSSNYVMRSLFKISVLSTLRKLSSFPQVIHGTFALKGTSLATCTYPDCTFSINHSWCYQSSFCIWPSPSFIAPSPSFCFWSV